MRTLFLVLGIGTIAAATATAHRKEQGMLRGLAEASSPAHCTQITAQNEETFFTKHRVRKGDSLSSIAKYYYFCDEHKLHDIVAYHTACKAEMQALLTAQNTPANEPLAPLDTSADLFPDQIVFLPIPRRQCDTPGYTLNGSPTYRDAKCEKTGEHGYNCHGDGREYVPATANTPAKCIIRAECYGGLCSDYHPSNPQGHRSGQTASSPTWLGIGVADTSTMSCGPLPSITGLVIATQPVNNNGGATAQYACPTGATAVQGTGASSCLWAGGKENVCVQEVQWTQPTLRCSTTAAAGGANAGAAAGANAGTAAGATSSTSGGASSGTSTNNSPGGASAGTSTNNSPGGASAGTSTNNFPGGASAGTSTNNSPGGAGTTSSTPGGSPGGATPT